MDFGSSTIQGLMGNSVPDTPYGFDREGEPITQDQMVTALDSLFEYEKQVRSLHQADWDRSWDRFHNWWNFSGKADWQSKRGIPVYSTLALKFAWEMIKPIALAGGKWFEATTPYDPYRQFVDVMRDFVWDRLNTNGANPENDFMTILHDSMLYAALCGNCYVLCLPGDADRIDYGALVGKDPFAEDEEDDTSLEALGLEDLPSLTGESDLPPLGGGLPADDDILTLDELDEFQIRWECINPRCVFNDTGHPGKPTYRMWFDELTPWEFRDMGEKFGWINIDEVIQGASESGGQGPRGSDGNRQAKEAKETSTPRKHRTIKLCHFIGTLPDPETGEAMFRDQYCAWANGFLVSPPDSLGLWHKKIPIVHGFMVRVPGSNYHKSLLVDSLDSQEGRVELLNLLIDYLMQVINPPTEVDYDQLHPSFGAAQLKGGVFPGKVFHLNKMGRSYAAVNRTAFPDIPAGVWQGLSFYKTEFSEGAALAETGAMPRTRNRISKTEFQERQAASGGIWQKIFSDVERFLIASLLHQSYLLYLQGTPQRIWSAWWNDRADRIDPPGQEQPVEGQPPSTQVAPEDKAFAAKLRMVATWDPKMRWKKFAGAFRFQTDIYTASASRADKFEKIQVMNQMSAENPYFASRVRQHKLAEQVVLALEENPEEMLWPDKGKTAEQPMNPQQGMAGVDVGNPPPVTPTSVPPIPPRPR